MKAILFHNPGSGTGEYGAEELQAILRLAGHDVTYCSTKSSGFKSALKKTYELAVVAGGDGTVGKVLKGLKDRSMPIGILPLGTANNIATSLGISGPPAEIVTSWTPKRTRELSVGVAKGPWGKMNFIEAVGFGAMVDATDSSIGENVEGDHRLVLGRDALRKALKKGKARNLHVTIDGKPITNKLLALEVLNIGYAGPGIPLRLAADPGDDLLDVVMIGDDQREGMLDWLGPAHEETAPPLTARRGREIVIEWKGKPPMRLDDGYIDPPDAKTKIKLRLSKDKLTILLPRGAKSPAAKRRTRSAAKKKPATRKRTPAKPGKAAKA